MKRFWSVELICAAALLAFVPSSATLAESPPTTPAASARPRQQLSVLLHDYYIANARFDPLWATLSGDNRFDDQLGLSIAPKLRARQFERYRSMRARLHALPADRLGRLDRTNYEILEHTLETALSFEPFPEHLLPVSQMDDVPVIALANLADGRSSQPIATPRQYRAFLKRISQLPRWIDQAITNMREGIRIGVVQPAALIVAALPQFQKLVSTDPEASVFYAPIRNLPATFAASDKRRLSAAYRAVIVKQLTPALARLATFLESDYLPAARSSSGWSALPNGHAWYLARVAASTTTALQPADIHALGLAEVERIQNQFALLAPRLGYAGPAAGLPGWIAAQERFRPFRNDQEVLDSYHKVKQTLGTRLPALFSLMPRADLEIRLEPELPRATASDHYGPPSADGSRPGIFWAVVNDAKQYGSTGMTSLFLHEGLPGHHFQVALQMEMRLPEFRRFGWISAYGEGWALYAETLGKEMGLYDDPAAYFGHLSYELLRAVRLVVDTGMHAKGWTREQSIRYMQETLGYREAEARNAAERYMAWPGQALAYKIGAMKIAELRQRATLALGERFSLPAFHAVILGDGSMPLALLEARVDRWIAASK